MKTLVIHPKDSTTDMLKEVYRDKNFTVINSNVSHSYLKKQIKESDRVIMLGHGSGDGLIGFKRFVVNSTLVYLLREKECICVWCMADVFVDKYKLNCPLYTGMIVSELEEAYCFSLCPSLEEIEESNRLFSLLIRNFIDGCFYLENYFNPNNSVIQFNRNNIYTTLQPL